MAFVYKADPVRGAEWARLFAARAPELPFHIWPDTGKPERVRYLAAWVPPKDIERQFPNLEVLFSTGAGIDQFDQHLPRGASLVHVGRGAHLDHQALLDALETGWLSSAVVDVTDPEPLPADHPFWAHPKILLTPHIASMTQPETAVEIVIENIRRHEAGAPLIGRVDRSRGY